jgi:hypothetical protein
MFMMKKIVGSLVVVATLLLHGILDAKTHPLGETPAGTQQLPDIFFSRFVDMVNNFNLGVEPREVYVSFVDLVGLVTGHQCSPEQKNQLNAIIQEKMRAANFLANAPKNSAPMNSKISEPLFNGLVFYLQTASPSPLINPLYPIFTDFIQARGNQDQKNRFASLFNVGPSYSSRSAQQEIPTTTYNSANAYASSYAGATADKQPSVSPQPTASTAGGKRRAEREARREAGTAMQSIPATTPMPTTQVSTMTGQAFPDADFNNIRTMLQTFESASVNDRGLYKFEQLANLIKSKSNRSQQSIIDGIVKQKKQDAEMARKQEEYTQLDDARNALPSQLVFTMAQLFSVKYPNKGYVNNPIINQLFKEILNFIDENGTSQQLSTFKTLNGIDDTPPPAKTVQKPMVSNADKKKAEEIKNKIDILALTTTHNDALQKAYKLKERIKTEKQANGKPMEEIVDTYSKERLDRIIAQLESQKKAVIEKPKTVSKALTLSHARSPRPSAGVGTTWEKPLTPTTESDEEEIDGLEYDLAHLEDVYANDDNSLNNIWHEGEARQALMMAYDTRKELEEQKTSDGLPIKRHIDPALIEEFTHYIKIFEDRLQKEALHVLGLQPGASAAQIKKQYAGFGLRFHPDKFKQLDKTEEEKVYAEKALADINNAYDILNRYRNHSRLIGTD